ncbi:glucosamine-6-phosphate deaminase [Dictyobacter sp. S3.2.2.5]|uniref:Glucosamine-6-phosphate deaminase n=1 Tax=Dictyobacter halimunensis TaxID=3026934 RepID=A0ABQ6FLB9_9CHLR|nr:glucosamine-6-phosphate deaminase [Dictyobacter sp. S3.2.2.5]
MQVTICGNAQELGRAAAALTANIINEQIAAKGKARLVLSTGASQFETLEALVKMDIEWEKVEMFHLDEYVGLSDRHPASFRKYLKERFVDQVPIEKVHYVNGEEDIKGHIEMLSREIAKEPIDLALIGIGENGHIAFNDPPADFDTTEAYIVVNLDENCKKQQVGEGWFASVDDVPRQAISMTVHQIMQSKVIISSVPHQAKARAIRAFFENEVTRDVPATILKTHPNYTLFLDTHSASLVDQPELRGER